MLFCFVATTLWTLAAAHAHEGLRGSVNLLNDRIFNVQWSVNASSNVIRFVVRAQTSGWFAIGFNEDKKMAKAGSSSEDAEDTVMFLRRGRERRRASWGVF